VKQRTEEIFLQVVDDAVADLKLPDVDDPLKPLVKKAVTDLLADLRPELDKLYTEANLAKIKQEVIGAVRAQVEKAVAGKLASRPLLAKLVGDLKGKFEASLNAKEAELTELFRAQVTIPKGTPVNLLLNIHASRAPYALKTYLKYKDNPRKVAEELLKLSDCPDLVDNRGHIFGAELTAEQKKDLIEFLKTL
jgi:hypothetical protein